MNESLINKSESISEWRSGGESHLVFDALRI